MTAVVLAVVLAPALAALVGLPIGRGSRAAAVACGVAGAAVALVAALVEAGATWGGGSATTGVTLLGEALTGGPVISLDLRADALAGVVAVAVCFVALCVQVYSAAYLRHEAHDAVATGVPGADTVADAAPEPERYPAYAASVSLFTAAMLLVVHADDVVLLLIGWEVMGLCSYLLVGHHSERPAARAAAVKAFLVTRVGDVGFLLGVVVLLAEAGTSSVGQILTAAANGEIPTSVATLAALLLLAGIVGKSAQFPLHSWLPDAMEGPTPVSALIHAATMVAAGVFVLARLHPLFLAAPAALVVAALIAAVTTLGAALAALAQDDLKRLLAWSTISQVGLMLCALAVAGEGGRDAGLLHLLSHAAFKALLFLAAGAITYLAGETLLARLGGLGRRSPMLVVGLGIGLAALAGIPPVSGFFSKEAVVTSIEEAALHGGGAVGMPVAWVVLVAVLLTTFVTAAYAARAFAMLVLAPGPDDRRESEPGKLPRRMSVPLVALAVPTVGLGLLLAAPPAAVAGAGVSVSAALLGTMLALAGAAIGLLPALAGRPAPRFDVAEALLTPAQAAFLRDGYRWDDVVGAVVVRPVRRLAAVVAAGDRDVVDAYVRGAATGSTWAGTALRRLQTGVVTSYLGWVLAGAVVLGLVSLT
ncbi:MAG TPA: proton-conducting transporter membrane subunit [Actinomycetales bacterium]|nr:proton-conducting transporter membrane subunit [Actinomycetales bacterium]